MEAQELKAMFEFIVGLYGEPVAPFGVLNPPGSGTLADVMRKDGFVIFGDIPVREQNLFLNSFLRHPFTAEDYWVSPFESESRDRDSNWSMFADEVVSERRYTYRSIVPEMLAKSFSANIGYRIAVPKGAVFYRARIHPQDNWFRPLTAKELGPPPPTAARAGRANSSGIPVLYTAKEPETAVAEVRPYLGAFVSIGRCTVKDDIFVIDLPASLDLAGKDPCDDSLRTELELAALTAELDLAFSEPVGPSIPERDYAPTQIAAELLRAAGFMGIRYRSELRKGGFNYVFFDPRDLLVEFDSSVRIQKIEIKTEPN
jgi:hypothetical protein